MQKIIINVPENIEYMSQWTNYQCPLGHCIVDKTVTGCGFTEYCLRNAENIILCSPRKLLLENKVDQHEFDSNILYIKNDSEKILDLDRDVKDKIKFDSNDISINYTEIALSLQEQTRLHYLNCITNLHQPCKLLVTYDSLHYVLGSLGDSVKNFRIIVDEFQSIFLDSYFKADTELDFVEYLQDCPNVLYLSATPMLDRYLDQLDYFKSLPYYELRWSSNYVEKVRVQRKHVTSLVTDTIAIIKDYKNGNFPQKIDADGNIHLSKELVVFCNSVSMITQLVKKNSLTTDEVNIICSNTPKNELKLKRIKHKMGKIPKRGEPHKMFTFCTRTTYLGADFYSTCASTIILSDANINSLALDISLDLPQIIGRQRLKENIFKNDIIIFYKTLRGIDSITKQEFDSHIAIKKRKTNDILRNYAIMDEAGKIANSEKYKRDALATNYSSDFVGVSRGTNYAIYNYLVEVADQRAWEVAQIDYQDNLSVTRSIYKIINGGELTEYKNVQEETVDNFLQEFFNIMRFREKMKLYCEFRKLYEGDKETVRILYHKIEDQRYNNYYNYYGLEGCKAVGYNDKPLREGISDKLKQDPLSSKIYQEFQISRKYTLKEIKEKLGEIYVLLEITKSPKASDIEEYFEVKVINITVDERRQKGYQLIKIK